MLIDNHGRTINYLRLAVTDRCNLRCFYCMPEEGIRYVDRKELMSYEEMIRITGLLARLGISKIRITGGEPFLRKDLMDFLQVIAEHPGIDTINLTTNGTLLKGKISALKELGIKNVNLSIDSLDRERFFRITRRDELPLVMESMHALLEAGIQTKLNMVVMAGKNIEDILPMVRLGEHLPLSIRFIEEMPFNGTAGQGNAHFWSHREIMSHIKLTHPNIEKLKDPPFSTSSNYKIPGFAGSFGIIAAFSRTFCGTCNRLRLTPRGLLKTCLYDNGVFNIKDLLRAGASDAELEVALRSALAHRAKDGFEAEENRIRSFAALPVSESMATIGG